jgi:Alpha-L-fucosidase
MTLGDQWSFRPGDKYKSAHQLIQLLVDIVGKGGNFLLNVGPQPDGELPDPALQRLREIGDWMTVNGEAIYGTRPIAPYKDGQLVFTQKGQVAYAIYLSKDENGPWPERVTFSGPQPAPASKVRLLGSDQSLAWESNGVGGTTVQIPPVMPLTLAPPRVSAHPFSSPQEGTCFMRRFDSDPYVKFNIGVVMFTSKLCAPTGLAPHFSASNLWLVGSRKGSRALNYWGFSSQRSNGRPRHWLALMTFGRATNFT